MCLAACVRGARHSQIGLAQSTCNTGIDVTSGAGWNCRGGAGGCRRRGACRGGGSRRSGGSRAGRGHRGTCLSSLRSRNPSLMQTAACCCCATAARVAGALGSHAATEGLHNLLKNGSRSGCRGDNNG